MRGTLFAAVAALLSSAGAGAQPVVLIQANIQAVLIDQATVVSLPVENVADHPVRAIVSLEWVNTKDSVLSLLRREVAITPGKVTIDVPFPLPESTVWLRLRYELAPDRETPRAFATQRGVSALSQIAPYIFEVKTGHVGIPRPGTVYAIQAQAVHPATRVPVEGVQWSASLKIDDVDLKPVHQSILMEGFVEFVFEIPRGKGEEPDRTGNLVITGQRGDFERSESTDFQVSDRLSAQIQTDKPIYQPGQAIHFRAVIFEPGGRAAEGKKIDLRIQDEEQDRVHSAQLVSSRFGVVQDDWMLPASASLGDYRFVLTNEGDSDYVIAQHGVTISRYELPTFSISAKPDRASYLPDQQATVEIRSTYLFGKPVPTGKIKIVRLGERTWNRKKSKYETNDLVVAEGQADTAGVFSANLDLREDHEALRDRDTHRFEDLHYAAYCTDPSSARTEEKKFDLRITREAIHVYVIRSDASGPLPAPVYISAFYPDGRPAETTVRLKLGGQSASARTNKYGVAKAYLVLGKENNEEIEARAVDAFGTVGTWDERVWSRKGEELRLETDRTLHRAGDSVRLRVSSPNPDSTIVLNAVADGRSQASQILRLVKGKAEATFPYQPEFRGAVTFVAWNGSNAESRYGLNIQASRTVIFPDPADLQITASAGKGSYRPGDKASLNMMVRSPDGVPVEAALGVAVVDQAVMERARTDSEFGHRSWFACPYCQNSNDPGIGAVHLSELVHLDLAKPVPDGLDLVAEALAARESVYLPVDPGQNLLGDQYKEFKPLLDVQVKQVQTALDKQFVSTLSYPRDEAALTKALGQLWSDLHDPWGMPYATRFGTERGVDVMNIVSSGPDQHSETGDDFSIGTIRCSYFRPLQNVIAQVLESRPDYPASEVEFLELLENNGIRLETLRDRWGTPYVSRIETRGSNRFINILSAGPDGKFETGDDFTIASFRGRYFQRESAAISRVVAAATQPPETEEQFRKILDNAGIDLSVYRDAWGRPYRLTAVRSSQYADRVTRSSIRVFEGPAVVRRDVTPVTQSLLTFSLRSDGPDGEVGTYDDFSVATFPVVLREEGPDSEPQQSDRSRAVPLKGTGVITGVVMDPAGAVVAGCTVRLLPGSFGALEYEAVSGADGVYRFESVPAGTYTVKVDVQGFKHAEIQQVPVTEGRTTGVDVALEVGSTSEAVTVTAEASVLNTEAAAVLARAADSNVGETGTPHLREYFPETLLWMPELLTDSQGRAKLDFALADTVTTWKVAVIASTLDGRVAETEADLRAFQPFFLDFNPPPILTSGDQVTLPATVRNYLDREQKVTVSLQPNTWSKTQEPVRRLTVAPNSSANVGYSIRAVAVSDSGRQRVSAAAGKRGDAIEKSIRIHPDGQEVTQTMSDLATGRANFSLKIPASAVAGGTRGEIRLYPNVLSALLESAHAILETPHGCAEQTISAGYANLIALRYARSIKLQDARIEKVALANIGSALDSVEGFQDAEGGVRYWGTGEPDIAVTAHALSFLVDASHLVKVDPGQIEALTTWLEKHQGKDGAWAAKRPGAPATDPGDALLTGVVARSLAAAKRSGVKVAASAMDDAYRSLVTYAAGTSEPYVLAIFASAALDSGDDEMARGAVNRLATLVRDEKGGAYWDLQTNTPFYGWGEAGRVETSALAVSALAAWREKHPEDARFESEIRRGLVFLLRARDRAGAWGSTQATMRVMQALTDAGETLGDFGGKGGTAEVLVNGRLFKSVQLTAGPRATDPIILNISGLLSAGENSLELVQSAGAGAVIIHITSTHWLPWMETQVRKSNELRMAVQFNLLDANAGDQIECSVKAERVGFHGYGMMIAEIGLPPGAEVDRSSLEPLLEDSSLGVDRYDVLPDSILLYLWPKAGGASFTFSLRARIPMLAKSAASRLYDYYNPEALAEVAPALFTIH